MFRNTRGFTLIELMVVVVIVGLLATLAFSNWLSMQASAKEAAVKENCHTVQLAAEDFSVRNDGIYAGNLADNAVGFTLVQLLPGAGPLENPFSRANTEPVDGIAAAEGQTGYLPIVQFGANVGYSINGVGRSPGLATVITLSSGHEAEVVRCRRSRRIWH